MDGDQQMLLRKTFKQLH